MAIRRISKSIVRRIVDAKRLLSVNILIKVEEFHLPSKRKLQQSDVEIEVIVIDVGEVEIERPKKKQRNYYSGKQGYHTLKMQLIVNQVTKEIICTEFDKGRKHDFNLLKQSKIAIKESMELLADKGYQGIKKYHKNSKTPYKKTKKYPLTIVSLTFGQYKRKTILN